MSELLLWCAECGKKKLYFNTSKQIGWCHVCARVVKRKEVNADGPEFVVIANRNIDEPSSCYPAWQCEAAKNYLESRWVGESTSYTAGVLWDATKHTLKFPIHSPAKEFPPSYQTRGISSSSHWYTEAGDRSVYCFGWPWLVRELKELIIVEGVFDVLSPGWLGYAIATLGTNVSDTLVLAIANRFDRCVLWYDPDPAGRKGSRTLQAKLQASGVGCRVVLSDVEPGDLGPEHPVSKRTVYEVTHHGRHTHS